MTHSSTTAADPTPFAIVLSGGGARGFSHAGVLRILESWGYRPAAIVGVSMGAVVGTTYASRPDWFEALLEMDTGAFPGPLGTDEANPASLIRRVRRAYAYLRRVDDMLRSWGPGEAAMDAGRAVLTELLGNRRLEDLSIPTVVSATDLRAGRRQILTSGLASDAVYASAALAGVLPPAIVNGSVLADGAYSDIAPIDVARSMGVPIVIAVDPGQLSAVPPLRNGLQAVVRAMEICHHRHADLRFQSADLVLRPAFRRSVDTLDFSAKRECAAAGMRAARAARRGIVSLLGPAGQR